jgi:signal transduction histidine kinase
LVYLLPFALSVLWLANTFRFVPIGSTSIVFSLGILSAIFTFTVVYFNYLPETTTFMIKVSGMAVVSLLAVWSVTGWVIGPQFIDQYPEDRIPQQRTLRFTPNAVGGYDVAVVPFHFDPIGEKWGNFTKENWTDILPLPFAFRFHEQTWREAYVSVIGRISFGQERIYQDLEYRYGSVPGILPLYPAQANWPLEEGQVFLNLQTQRVTLTWRQSAEGFSTVGTYTFQLTLYPSGVFEITHNEITDVKSRVFWTIGVIAGDATRAPQQVNLADGLPLSGGTEGMVHDSYRAFRSYLHRMLLPLAWLVVCSVLLFVVGLPLFLHFNLVKPLGTLLEGVTQVNSGNLQLSIPVHFPDEIGFLTRSVNDMAASINLQIAERRRVEGDLRELAATLEQRIADRTRELSALYDISALATSTHDIELLLHESLKRTLAAMHCDVGAILLVTETKDTEAATRLRVAAHQGLPPELPIAPMMTAAAHGLFAMLRDKRQPVFIPDLSVDPRVPMAMRALGSQAFLIAPLQVEKDVLGIVGVLRDTTPAFTSEEIALLATISDQLGAAVQSYHLRQALQKAALLEERQRLSRDLHDSVTQSLYGLVALSEAGQARLETAAPQKVEEILTLIGKTARQALREMRLFIYQMRPPDLEREGLAAALQLRLAAVEGHSGVQARLLTDDDLHLPRHIEDAFYQIAQESLNNTLRHANAKAVTVRLHQTSHQLELEIVDDGQGFDPGQVGRSGLGLTSMRERAQSIGGTLTISAAPGSGTQIRVSVERERLE